MTDSGRKKPARSRPRSAEPTTSAAVGAQPAVTAHVADFQLKPALPETLLSDGARRRQAMRLLLDQLRAPEGSSAWQGWRDLVGEDAPEGLSFPLTIDDTTWQLQPNPDRPDWWLLRSAAGAEVRTTSVVLNRLLADSVLADWIELLSERLHTDAAALLTGLDLVAETMPAGADNPSAGLTIEEEAALRAAGSLRQPMPEPAERASVRTAVQHASTQSAALTVAQAAEQLGVTGGRIRQRLTARTLHGVQVDGAWRLPGWQFGADGTPVRGLEKVLPKLPDTTHPIAVQAWFTTPKSDLQFHGEPVTPLEWLDSGGRVDEVTALIADLEWAP